VQGRRKSQQHVVAHRCGGREVRLARGGIREHDAFLGHEMRGPAGTGRGGVSMAGGREGQGARKENGMRGHRFISAMVYSDFAYVFRLSVFMRKVAGKHPFCVLIYMNSYIFHTYFILIILLSYLIFDFVCLTLSLADTHGIAKYARIYIQRYTHTRTHKNKKHKKRKRKKKDDVNDNQQTTVTHFGENKRLHLESSKQNYYIISF